MNTYFVIFPVFFLIEPFQLCFLFPILFNKTVNNVHVIRFIMIKIGQPFFPVNAFYPDILLFLLFCTYPVIRQFCSQLFPICGYLHDKFIQEFTKHPLHRRFFNRFCHKIIKTFVHQHLSCPAYGICRQCYNRCMTLSYHRQFMQPLHTFHTIHLRHHMIHENKVIILPAYLLDGFFSAQSRFNLHTIMSKHTCRNFEIHRTVIDY